MKWHVIKEPVIANEPFIKKVQIAGKAICLVKYEDELFAVGAVCPHAGFDLSRGWCKEGKLVCPIHRFSYDLQTGKGSTGQNDYINTYPVKVKNGQIYIGIETFWEKVKQAFK